MKCVKVTGIILLTALSMSVIGAGSASAMKAIPLLEEEPTLKPIEPGDPLQFASNDVELVTSMGTIQCSDATIDATLRTNGLKADSLTVGAISMAGTGGGACASTTPFGDASIIVVADEWTGSLSTKGKSQLIGNPDLVGNPDLLVEASFGGGTIRAAAMRCTWQASTLKGTFNTDGQQIKINEAQEHFALHQSASDPGCPKGKGRLSAVWALSAAAASGELVPAIIGNPDL
jgi:hypothetical protein